MAAGAGAARSPSRSPAQSPSRSHSRSPSRYPFQVRARHGLPLDAVVLASTVPSTGSFCFRAKREQLKRDYGLLPESLGQIVVYVLYSLDSGRVVRGERGGGRCGRGTGSRSTRWSSPASTAPSRCAASLPTTMGVVPTHPTPYTLHLTPYTLHLTPYTLHLTPYTIHHTPCTIHIKVALLPGKGNSTSHGARPVHQIITMIKWIWTSRLTMKKTLSPSCPRPSSGEKPPPVTGA